MRFMMLVDGVTSLSVIAIQYFWSKVERPTLRACFSWISAKAGGNSNIFLKFDDLPDHLLKRCK